MGLITLLSEIKDALHQGNLCAFNGYLEDYLGTIDAGNPAFELLSCLLELDKDLKVIEGLKISISKTSISNQIIRYKDINKLGEYPLTVAYLVYQNKEDGKAFLIDSELVYAKGLFYVLSEDPSPFNKYRDSIITIPYNCDLELVKKVYEALSEKKNGHLQRLIDQSIFASYDESFEHAKQLAASIGSELVTLLEGNPSKRAKLIDAAIAKWFLLKKFTYVQYMVNKDLLNTRHEGNVKAQRNTAKVNADEIRFMPLSELWRIGRK